MKRAIIIFALAIFGVMSAMAQNIALGERVPELKVSTWIGGHQPVATSLTYIEFFHSSNKSCITSIEQLKSLTDKMQGRLRILVITQEGDAKTISLLTPYAIGLVGVGLDPSGRTNAGFGVSYVPFGVLVDAKNRALWMGNSLQLTPSFIEKISK